MRLRAPALLRVGCLMGVGLICAIAEPLDFQHSYAIVVGVNVYSSPHWPRLQYARKDAEGMAQYLKGQGFVVTELYDQRATKRNIMTAFSEIATKIQSDDRVLIFISGHGTDQSWGDQVWGYIVPSDGTDAVSYISYSELWDTSRQMNKARHQLFIMDACFSGLLVKARSGGGSQDVPDYISAFASLPAREALTAGGPAQQVLDTGPNGHSVFTNALLEGLDGAADANHDGFITFSELESYVVTRVSNRLQTPSSGSLPEHGGGHFFFRSPVTKLVTTISKPQSAATAPRRGDLDELESASASKSNALLGYARTELEKAAGAGPADDMNNLGLLYENGVVIPRDHTRAQQWFEKAAAVGNGAGMTNLGLLQASGAGAPPDYAHAREWYEKAAAAGDSEGMVNLGVLYENGWGLPRDYSKARQLYERAAASGSGAGMNNLGVLYENGWGVTKDYQRAREWYEKAAEKGISAAMTSIGALFVNSWGVPQDYAQARKWFQRAAALDNAVAMSDLGALYENGWGVAKDYTQAREWYSKAAARGNAYAQSHLKTLGN